MPDRPLDDEFDRQTFYRGHDPEADAEDDYELEPPDAEVIAGEKRRADEAVQHASKAVDLDELYREETSVTAQDIEEYLKDFRFQFGTKHLLMAMTAVAMLFVLGRFVFGGFAPLLLVLTFTVLASIYGWFSWHEHKRRQEWERKREELYRRHQQRHDKRIDTNHEQAAADDDWGSVNRLASIDARSPARGVGCGCCQLACAAAILHHGHAHRRHAALHVDRGNHAVGAPRGHVGMRRLAVEWHLVAPILGEPPARFGFGLMGTGGVLRGTQSANAAGWLARLAPGRPSGFKSFTFASKGGRGKMPGMAGMKTDDAPRGEPIALVPDVR